MCPGAEARGADVNSLLQKTPSEQQTLQETTQPTVVRGVPPCTLGHTHGYQAVTTPFSKTSCHEESSTPLVYFYQLLLQQSIRVNNPKLHLGQLYIPKLLSGTVVGEAAPQLPAGLVERFNYG